MKLKVERQFKDKNTDEMHKVDDVFEVDDKRGKELLSDNRNLVTLIKEDAEKAEKPKATSKAKSKKSDK